MNLSEILAGIVALGTLAVLVAFVGKIAQSMVSQWRLRGWRDPLATWGVVLPTSLVEFYQSSAATRYELCLSQSNGEQERVWFIGSFIPLTKLDLQEWINSTNLPGIPIASDWNKGVYYLPFAELRKGGPCPVLHRDLSGAWPITDSLVAQTIQEFVEFREVQPPDE
jgi:hypothetical protein